MVTFVFKIMPLPVTAKVPEVIPRRFTAPLEETVRLFVPVLSKSLAVIAPEPLRMTSGSVKV